MALYPLPKQYSTDFKNPRKKPVNAVEIDRNNTYGKNVFAAWSFATPQDWLENTATGDKGILVGSSVYLKGSEGNLNIESDGNGVNHRIDLGSVNSSNPLSLTDSSIKGSYTIFSRVFINTGVLSTTFARLIDKSSSGNASNGWNIVYASSGDTLSLNISEATGDIRITAPPRGVWFNIAIVVDRNNATWQFYTNTGVNNSGINPKGASSTTTNAAIVNWNHSTDRQWDGGVAYIHMHYGAYSESKVRQYWENPYQILKPKNPPMYYTADAAPPVGFEPQWAIHANKLINMVQ